MYLQSTIHDFTMTSVGPQVPQAHEWEQKYYNGLYGDLSDHYLGVKNTSESLTLCPCLNLRCFLSIFGRSSRHMDKLLYKVRLKQTTPMLIFPKYHQGLEQPTHESRWGTIHKLFLSPAGHVLIILILFLLLVITISKTITDLLLRWRASTWKKNKLLQYFSYNYSHLWAWGTCGRSRVIIHPTSRLTTKFVKSMTEARRLIAFGTAERQSYF